MAGLTSTVNTAIANLYADFQIVGNANPDLQIMDNWSTANYPPTYLEVTGVSNWEQEPASIGNRARNETFVINCTIRVIGGATDVATVRNQAFAYLEDAVAAITADPTLGTNDDGNPLLIFAQFTQAELTQGIVSSSIGWAAVIEFGVHCQAYLEL
jgi:hypothetical protein